MSKEGDGKVENLRKSFGEKMLAKKLGLPVWAWTLDLIVLIAFTKWTGFVVTIQVAYLLASFIYKKLGESKTKRPVVARALMTVIFMLIPGFFLSAILVTSYQFANMTNEEWEAHVQERKADMERIEQEEAAESARQELAKAERNKTEFLGVELGATLDSDKYKDFPRQYVTDGGSRYYVIRVPLAKKLFPIEGFDVVNVHASAKSHVIHSVELVCDHSLGAADFEEYRKALEQMMRSKYGIKPEDSDSERHVSFRLKGGQVYFRTGGSYHYSNGKVYETGPYTTSLSYWKDDLSNLAGKEEKAVVAEESKQKAKESADRVNKTANAGMDLL